MPQQLARLVANALAMHQVTRVLIGHPHVDRRVGGTRSIERQELGDVLHPRAKTQAARSA